MPDPILDLIHKKDSHFHSQVDEDSKVKGNSKKPEETTSVSTSTIASSNTTKNSAVTPTSSASEVKTTSSTSTTTTTTTTEKQLRAAKNFKDSADRQLQMYLFVLLIGFLFGALLVKFFPRQSTFFILLVSGGIAFLYYQKYRQEEYYKTVKAE